MSVKHALLALLSEGPKYGLQLREEVESDYDLSLALVVDAELFRLDSVIRWLAAADGRLKRAAADQATAGRATAGRATGTTAARKPAPAPLPNLRRRTGTRR